mmetsp:Transcript_1643/g.3082  ORF Transcript_1643/g.3082 Transcript_1643/m.3082 type:complete len:178 (-) Transcript_1643:1948-2481(-)
MRGGEEEEEEEDVLPRWLEGDSLAPFIPASEEMIDGILKLAQVTDEDVVLDLGCGDGRVCVEAAARTGARAIGVEIDPVTADRARKRAASSPVAERVCIVEGDAREVVPKEEVSVVVVYLLPDATEQMLPQYHHYLDSGARLISVFWPIDALGEPSKVDQERRLFHYVKSPGMKKIT